MQVKVKKEMKSGKFPKLLISIETDLRREEIILPVNTSYNFLYENKNNFLEIKIIFPKSIKVTSSHIRILGKVLGGYTHAITEYLCDVSIVLLYYLCLCKYRVLAITLDKLYQRVLVTKAMKRVLS